MCDNLENNFKTRKAQPNVVDGTSKYTLQPAVVDILKIQRDKTKPFRAEFKLPLGKGSVKYVESLLSKIENPVSMQAKIVSECLSKSVPCVEIEKLILREIISKPEVCSEILSAMDAKSSVGPKQVRMLGQAIELSKQYHSLGLTSGCVLLYKTFTFKLKESDIPHDVAVFGVVPNPAESKVLAQTNKLLPQYPGSAALFCHIYEDNMLVRECQHNVDQDIKRISTKEDYAKAIASRGSWKEHLLFTAIKFAKKRGLKKIQTIPAVTQLRMSESNVDTGRINATYDEFPKRMGFELREYAFPSNAPLFFLNLSNIGLTQVWEMDVDKAYEKFGLGRIIS